jgi:hypothetical protein
LRINDVKYITWNHTAIAAVEAAPEVTDANKS